MAYTREQTRESRAHARKLTEALSSGWRPEPVRTPIQLQRDEHCYAQSNAQLWQYLEGDSSYIHKSRGGFGLVGVALVAGTAAGNSSRKRRAAREAEPRFRPVDQGSFFLTDMRFAIQGQAQWTDLWYEDIRMSSCDGNSITLHIANMPPTQLHAWPIDYYFALYHFLTNGDIIEIPPDPS
jgi:hypothetical protein